MTLLHLPLIASLSCLLGPAERAAWLTSDEDRDGFLGVEEGGDDCDDLDPLVFVGAPEYCNGQDDDCDDAVDEDALDEVMWFVDADGDGAGVAGDVEVACTAPDGYVASSNDCDDSDAALTPHDVDGDGSTSCDGDCDDSDATMSNRDEDGDGFSTCAGDCDDTRDDVAPGALEIWYDGVDQDCDGGSDGDQDGDGVDGGSGGDDCDDSDAEVHPGAAEACGDGVDANCSGSDGLEVPDAFGTIQDAVDAALGGTEPVCVWGGVYFESVVVEGGDVVVVGVAGPDDTVIDGGEDGVTVSFGEGAGDETLFGGFTLVGGQSETGGGLSVVDASPTLRHLVVVDNVAQASASNSDLYWSGTLMAEAVGGGVYIAGDSAPRLENVVIAGNRVEASVSAISETELHLHADAYGGGLYVGDDAEVVAVNVVLYGNQAHASTVGTIYCQDGVFTGRGYATPLGAGVYVSEGGSLELVNAVVAANTLSTDTSVARSCDGFASGSSVYDYDYDAGGALSVAGSIDVSYSDFWENASSFDGVSDPTGSDGNVAVDPGFVDDEARDFTLQGGSELVDAGDPAIEDADGSRSDMGAYGGPEARWE